ncbi:unnamed protein product [Allacma fusca]|uniref:Fructose-2,6-bisphosphatase TIGAR n=1 Tax=Allacma fusca TaxID=39272 RepID=A0A8J2KDK1_9HEXA|nr:unnamed protein product [Allacma fusca]
MHYFTIVRHGQTPVNVINHVQSRTGGELTPLGVNMAKSLGRYLKNEIFTRILSSDLHRCRLTTENIISQMTVETPPVEYTKILRERDYGDWEFLPGQVTQDKRIEMNLPKEKDFQVDVPNGESYQDCLLRAGRLFSGICKIVDESSESIDENILAVSHGTFINTFVDYLMSSPLLEIKNETTGPIPPMLNTCRTRLAISKSGDQKRTVTITHLFNADHLKDCAA